jgi:hypothetical protein
MRLSESNYLYESYLYESAAQSGLSVDSLEASQRRVE